MNRKISVYRKFLSFLLCFSLFVIMIAPPATALAVEEISEVEEVELISSSSTQHSKAIVVIPGLTGSVLLNESGDVCWVWVGRSEQLACKEDGTSENEISPEEGGYGIFAAYSLLCSRLSSEFGNEYDVLFFSYDWRMSCTDTAEELEDFVAGYSEVVLVAHSMGGLVASAFCTTAANRAKVDKLITLGTPYTGAAHTIYVAETGNYYNPLNPVVGGQDVIKMLVQNFPSFYQIAPTNRYGEVSESIFSEFVCYASMYLSCFESIVYSAHRPWATTSGGAMKSMCNEAIAFHNSLFINNTHIANGGLVDTYKIYGAGVDTVSTVYYDSSGNYLGVSWNNNGDGTVPVMSAVNNQMTATFSVNADHMSLINNSDSLDLVVDIISGNTVSTLGANSESYTTNDKGWVESRDNRRVVITVPGECNAEIVVDGEPLELIGDTFYDSEGEYAGKAWIVGNGQVMYVLKYNEYDISVDGSADSITVEYMDDGYYEYSATYENPGDTQMLLSFSGETLTDVAVTLAGSTLSVQEQTVQPTVILNQAELNERNGE